MKMLLVSLTKMSELLLTIHVFISGVRVFGKAK